tara:strand:+ start:402 stop:1553 length:1152 start_codon:yes stop_codon:yes gene_type:complete
MKCLHICNDFTGSKVHLNLYKKLEDLDLEQVIYNPIKSSSLPKFESRKSELNSIALKSKSLTLKHRIFYKKKIKFLYEDLLENIDVNKLSIVHATTLFSDGGVAYQLYKEFNIPYIVAIRGTDINLFLKYRVDLYNIGYNIINNAQHIVFISRSLEKNFFESYFAKKYRIPKVKALVIANGVDEFWLNNLSNQRQITKPSKFLYIGQFNYNKNILPLIKSFLKLSEKYNGITLSLVGGGGKFEDEIKDLVKKNPNNLKYYGAVYDKKELLKIYRSHDIFTMISLSETFGLVYIEALTQGLPILFTKNQGIDGTFKDKIGLAINPKSENSMINGLEYMIKNYNNFEINKIDFSKFIWKDIAKQYLELYTQVEQNSNLPLNINRS